MANPIHPRRDVARLNASPRCGARTRQGHRCRSPAVRTKKRCRMHGGGRGSGAPSGRRNGSYRDGTYTAEAVAFRQFIVQFLKDAEPA